MSRNRLVRLLPPLAALLALAAAVPAAAQVPANVQVYAVKFLCGSADARAASPYRAVEPGNYGTLVNVTNLSLANVSVNLHRSVRVEGLQSVALPNAAALQAGQVQTVDCGAISQALAQLGFQADGRFVEGYVMLSYYTNQIDPALLSLDVTAAYSYSGQKADTGASLQVVHVEPRAMFQPE
jgi:hypothetical protein